MRETRLAAAIPLRFIRRRITFDAPLRDLYSNLSCAHIGWSRYHFAPNVYIQGVPFQDSKFFTEFKIEFSLARMLSLRELFLFPFATKDGNIRIPLSSISHSFPIISSHFSLFSWIFFLFPLSFFSLLSSFPPIFLLFFFFSLTFLDIFSFSFASSPIVRPFSFPLFSYSSGLLSTRFQRAFIWIYFALI